MNEVFREIVDKLRIKSTCSHVKNAAIIVKDDVIISSGYTNTPEGIPTCEETEILVDLLKSLYGLAYNSSNKPLIANFSDQVLPIRINNKHISNFDTVLKYFQDQTITLENLYNIDENKEYELVREFGKSISQCIDAYNKSFQKYKTYIEPRYDYDTIHRLLVQIIGSYKTERIFLNITHMSLEIPAEINAVISAFKVGLSIAGSDMYIYELPNPKNLKYLIVNGIQKVFYINEAILDREEKQLIQYLENKIELIQL